VRALGAGVRHLKGGSKAEPPAPHPQPPSRPPTSLHQPTDAPSSTDRTSGCVSAYTSSCVDEGSNTRLTRNCLWSSLGVVRGGGGGDATAAALLLLITRLNAYSTDTLLLIRLTLWGCRRRSRPPPRSHPRSCHSRHPSCPGACGWMDGSGVELRSRDMRYMCAAVCSPFKFIRTP